MFWAELSEPTSSKAQRKISPENDFDSLGAILLRVILNTTQGTQNRPSANPQAACKVGWIQVIMQHAGFKWWTVSTRLVRAKQRRRVLARQSLTLRQPLFDNGPLDLTYLAKNGASKRSVYHLHPMDNWIWHTHSSAYLVFSYCVFFRHS